MRNLFLLFALVMSAIYSNENIKPIYVEVDPNMPNNLIKNLYVHLDKQSFPKWMMDNIKKEFSNFSFFSSKDIERMFLENPDRAFAHYKIRNGKVYYGYYKHCSHFLGIILEYAFVFHKILNQPGFSIQEGDFLMEMSDGNNSKEKYPIFCFSKNHNSNCILVPDWYAIWVEMPKLLEKIDRASFAFPWHRKLNKGFFIGVPNGSFQHDHWRDHPRTKLVLFSIDNPDLVWARFTHLKPKQSHICEEMTNLDYLLGSNRISEHDACRYKYLFDVDGWSCSFYRTPWVLRSNCVCLKHMKPKQHSFQWYYSGLKPYVHYIPYEDDCSDLKDIILWLRQNDDKARKIAINGSDFVKKYLNVNISYLYLYYVLIECNKLNSSINK